MIITRTPLRISFPGGGTDYQEWYREHGGAAPSTDINRCCYITTRQPLPFASVKTVRRSSAQGFHNSPKINYEL